MGCANVHVVTCFYYTLLLTISRHYLLITVSVLLMI